MNLDAMIDVFFFNSPATTEIYTYLHTLSRHDALPICQPGTRLRQRRRNGARIDREQQIALVDDRAVAEMHAGDRPRDARRSEEHTSELQSLMRISYAVFCLKKKITASTPTLWREVSLPNKKEALARLKQFTNDG